MPISSVTPDASQISTPQVMDAEDASIDEGLQDSAAGTEQATQETIDWESRFKGLQGTVQQLAEARRAEEAQRLQLEAELFAARTAEMEPQERQQAWQAYQTVQGLQQQQQTVAYQQQQMNEAAKVMVAQVIAQKYGVPKDDLIDFESPQAMEKFASRVSESRRQTKKQVRAEAGTNRFEGAQTHTAPAPRKHATIAEASEALRRIPVPVR